jgi:predicted benzoate:H+ symporter BenE
MGKYIMLALAIIVLIVYFFLYLGIELDLKFGLESISDVKSSQLINTSFRIRAYLTIQLVLFVVVLLTCLYLIFRKIVVNK